MKLTNPTLYKVTGYARVKDEDEWYQLQDDLVIACPDEMNPYELINSQLKEVFAYWIIKLNEIPRS